MKRAFIDRRFHKSVADIIAKANQIIEKYAARGMSLTVRQMYYRFIAMDLFPATWIDEKYNKKNGLDPNTKNTIKNYKRLASILNDGRMAGEISWAAIEDRTRNLRVYSSYNDPTDAVLQLSGKYAVDLWADQPAYCEVWIEKDALIGVVANVCNEFRVPHFSTRGYTSQSEAYEAGQRIRAKIDEGRQVTLYHFGDHDPSGIDMSSDIDNRVTLFGLSNNFNFVRLALNMDQVRQYNPPPNPAKETDSRFAAYSATHGDESWELDSLEPEVIEDIARQRIEALLDRPKFDAALKREQEGKASLAKLADKWSTVEKWLRRK